MTGPNFQHSSLAANDRLIHEAMLFLARGEVSIEVEGGQKLLKKLEWIYRTKPSSIAKLQTTLGLFRANFGDVESGIGLLKNALQIAGRDRFVMHNACTGLSYFGEARYARDVVLGLWDECKGDAQLTHVFGAVAMNAFDFALSTQAFTQEVALRENDARVGAYQSLASVCAGMRDLMEETGYSTADMLERLELCVGMARAAGARILAHGVSRGDAGTDAL